MGKIEVTHRFSATHQHRVPPGEWSKRHRHSWVWSVHIVGDEHQIYGWVADFDEVRTWMVGSADEHYIGTTEQILVNLVAVLEAKWLPSGYRVTWARLEETPDQAAILERKP